jgi:tripartite-type tricarboxylate transporter receptor subunit TctC
MKRFVAFAVLWMSVVATASAQSYPDHSIRLIVPYPPGGGADAIARVMSQPLAERLGQPIVIENRAGANGNIGSAIVAKAPPDGYTLLMNTIGLVLSQSVYKSLPFNVLDDFAPVSLVAGVPHVLVVGPTMHVATVPELIKDAKSRPGQINYASVGVGSPFQMSAALFTSLTGVKMTEVPYQGGGPAVLSVVAGQTDLTFANLLAVLPQIQGNKVKALAVTSSKRSTIASNIPTMAEAGVPGYELTSWFGIWAPAHTPKAIVDRVNTAIVQVLNDPQVRAKLVQQGADVLPGTPDQFDAYIHAEYTKWDKVVKAAGIRAD